MCLGCSAGTSILPRCAARSDALRHNLATDSVIANLEGADDYRAFEAAVVRLNGESAAERKMVLRLAAIGIETALLNLCGRSIRRGKTWDEARKAIANSYLSPGCFAGIPAGSTGLL